MKKIYLSMLIVGAGFFTSYAQSSEGGLPLINQLQSVPSQRVELRNYPTPDFTTILNKELQDEKNGVAKPYMVATVVPADISLKNSGTWSYLDNGTKIWRVSISVPESKALSILYDQFNLPKGVRMFLTNKNNKQVLGAYTSSNTNAYNNFITEAVQGDLVNLEMDIDAGIEMSAIQFHINKLEAYFRGVNDLARFASTDATPASPLDEQLGTSPCHLNAVCPIVNVALDQYKVPFEATVRVFIQDSAGAGFCSGTLINNTGNFANGTFTPLLLTASHCDNENHHNNTYFSQWQFKFNYYYDSCNGTHLHSPSPTLNGANFKARANYQSFNTAPGEVSMVGDFLLLQLTDPGVSMIQDVYYAGWNRDPNIYDEDHQAYYDFFIGYHHPNGDVKKVSWGTSVSPSGTFNQETVFGTHWLINFMGGGCQPGSSGSGLFDVDGLLIGDASAVVNFGGGCGPFFSKTLLYSKLSYDWDNQFDQTTFPQYAGAQSQLKSWLDPMNTGQLTLGYAKPDCSNLPQLGINDLKTRLNESINLYPNPNQTGLINANFNLTAPETIKVTVYNAMGRFVKSFMLANIMSGSYSFDCSEFSNGIYMMNFSANDVVVSKKFIIAK